MGPAYDVVTVGGGLAGAALARTLAARGARVLVVERERRFGDRVRGEILLPWGVAEAAMLGLDASLRESCGHDAPWFDVRFGPEPVIRRDFRVTTPQARPALAFFHPAMQEHVLGLAAAAGAEVRRGSRVRGLAPGPAVLVETDGTVERVRARLVVGADGRGSAMRGWAGFEIARDPARLLFAGVLLEDVAVAPDTSVMVVGPGVGRVAYLFPQGAGRVRAYVGWHAATGVARLQGAGDWPRFVAECRATGADPAWYAAARPAGPLATFDGADTWVPHPYRDGVALVGDAAATSDPTWGQGMALALRDVRVLAEHLLATADWDAAAHAYADEHDRYYGVTRTVEGWYADLFLDVGPGADIRRAQALPRVAADPTRLPDTGFSGPDVLADGDLRRRFWGED